MLVLEQELVIDSEENLLQDAVAFEHREYVSDVQVLLQLPDALVQEVVLAGRGDLLEAALLSTTVASDVVPKGVPRTVHEALLVEDERVDPFELVGCRLLADTLKSLLVHFLLELGNRFLV